MVVKESIAWSSYLNRAKIGNFNYALLLSYRPVLCVDYKYPYRRQYIITTRVTFTETSWKYLQLPLYTTEQFGRFYRNLHPFLIWRVLLLWRRSANYQYYLYRYNTCCMNKQKNLTGDSSSTARQQQYPVVVWEFDKLPAQVEVWQETLENLSKLFQTNKTQILVYFIWSTHFLKIRCKMIKN